eukprot:gene16728-18422_t
MAIGKNISCYRRFSDKDVSVLVDHRLKEETLLFEKGVVAELGQSETDEIKKLYSKHAEFYAFLGALKLYIGEDYFIFLFFVSGCISIGKIREDEIFKITSCTYLPLQESSDVDSRLVDLQRLLSSGSFFFSWSSNCNNTFDLSLCAQRRHLQQQSDNRFFWNHALHLHLERFSIDCNQWLAKIMCGYVQIKTVYVGKIQAKACLISRLSCERAGTRFNVRGTNDEGHVANFVETEQLIVLNDYEASYIQTRGSVPVFWEQPGIQVGSHRIKFSRGFEASSPAFDRHIGSLKALYGYQLLVNLLGRKEGEHALSMAYKDHLKNSKHSFDTHIILFDYHYHCRGGKTENLLKLIDKAHASIENFGIFVYKDDHIERSQVGTIRTNCIDCVDRTNAVQSKIGRTVLANQLECLGIADKTNMLSRFEEVYKSIWLQNGDQLSKLYSGTGAMDSSVKGTLSSKFHDGAVTVKRAIVNNFLDGSKQEAIDILLLGNTFIGKVGERARALLTTSFLHSSPAILKEMCARHEEYTKTSPFRVCCGTWNVNGGKHFRSIAYKHMSMHDWLLDFYKKAPDGIIDKENTNFDHPPDIFALGFEELVDLNANNIISTSSTQKKEWGSELQKVISRDQPYVLLTAEQLVGVCLYVFVRTHHLPYIRDVAVDVVKTGLKGNTGNKGGVAIRFLLHSTSICFVCAHLAAGQSNVQERNNNYFDITKRISFPMGSTLSSHDYVFWCGDFNYRIDLPIDDVKQLVTEQVWPELRANDQLSVQRAEGKIFRGFQEGPIRFAPTYKYDLFSDDYDTSDKMRTPAWTDRVLWHRKKYKKRETDSIRDTGGVDSDDESPKREQKRETVAMEDIWNPGKILYYGRAELKTSDHRPVIAVVEIDVQSVQASRVEKVHNEVIESFGPANPTIVVKLDNSLQDVPEDHEIDMDSALQVFQQYGDIVLVRAVDDEILFTYDNGKSALASLEQSGEQIDGFVIEVCLKNPDTLVKTEPSVHSLISLDAHHETNDNEEASFNLTDLLSCSRENRSGEEMIDSDDEVEEIQSSSSSDNTSSVPKRPSSRPQRPFTPPQRPGAPPQRREAPKRPTAPKKPQDLAKQQPQRPVVADKIEVRKSVNVERVVPLKEAFVTSRSTPSFSEFDPLSNAAEERANEAASKPARPVRPNTVPVKPRPPLIDKKKEDTKNEIEKKLEISKETKNEERDDGNSDVQENISTPFNVTHLLHVDQSNVDEFMVQMSQSKPASVPSKPASVPSKFEGVSSKPASVPSKSEGVKTRRQVPEKPKLPGGLRMESSKITSTGNDVDHVGEDNPVKRPVAAKRVKKKPAPKPCDDDNTSSALYSTIDEDLKNDIKAMQANVTDDVNDASKKAPPRPKKRPVSAAITLTESDRSDFTMDETTQQNRMVKSASIDYHQPPSLPLRNSHHDEDNGDVDHDGGENAKDEDASCLYAKVNKTRTSWIPLSSPEEVSNEIVMSPDGKPILPPRKFTLEDYDDEVDHHHDVTDENENKSTEIGERTHNERNELVRPPLPARKGPPLAPRPTSTLSDDIDGLYTSVDDTRGSGIFPDTAVNKRTGLKKGKPPLPPRHETKDNTASVDAAKEQINNRTSDVFTEIDLSDDVTPTTYPPRRPKPPLPPRHEGGQKKTPPTLPPRK